LRSQRLEMDILSTERRAYSVGAKILVHVPDLSPDGSAEALPSVEITYGRIVTKLWIKLLDPKPNDLKMLEEIAVGCVKSGNIREGNHPKLLLIEEEDRFDYFAVNVGQTTGSTNVHLSAYQQLGSIAKTEIIRELAN